MGRWLSDSAMIYYRHEEDVAVAVHRAPGCLLVPPGPMPRYLLLLLLPLLLPLIVASTACLATRCKEEAGPGPLGDDVVTEANI